MPISCATIILVSHYICVKLALDVLILPDKNTELIQLKEVSLATKDQVIRLTSILWSCNLQLVEIR